MAADLTPVQRRNDVFFTLWLHSNWHKMCHDLSVEERELLADSIDEAGARLRGNEPIDTDPWTPVHRWWRGEDPICLSCGEAIDPYVERIGSDAAGWRHAKECPAHRAERQR